MAVAVGFRFDIIRARAIEATLTLTLTLLLLLLLDEATDFATAFA